MSAAPIKMQTSIYNCWACDKRNRPSHYMYPTRRYNDSRAPPPTRDRERERIREPQADRYNPSTYFGARDHRLSDRDAAILEAATRISDVFPVPSRYDPFAASRPLREMWLPPNPRPARRPSVSPPRERPAPPQLRPPPAFPPVQRMREPAPPAEHTIYGGKNSDDNVFYLADRERVVFSNGRTLEYMETRRDKNWTELWVDTAVYYKDGVETHRATRLHFTKNDLPNNSPLFVRKASQPAEP